MAVNSSPLQLLTPAKGSEECGGAMVALDVVGHLPLGTCEPQGSGFVLKLLLLRCEGGIVVDIRWWCKDAHVAEIKEYETIPMRNFDKWLCEGISVPITTFYTFLVRCKTALKQFLQKQPLVPPGGPSAHQFSQHDVQSDRILLDPSQVYVAEFWKGCNCFQNIDDGEVEHRHRQHTNRIPREFSNVCCDVTTKLCARRKHPTKNNSTVESILDLNCICVNALLHPKVLLLIHLMLTKMVYPSNFLRSKLDRVLKKCQNSFNHNSEASCLDYNYKEFNNDQTLEECMETAFASRAVLCATHLCKHFKRSSQPKMFFGAPTGSATERTSNTNAFHCCGWCHGAFLTLYPSLLQPPMREVRFVFLGEGTSLAVNECHGSLMITFRTPTTKIEYNKATTDLDTTCTSRKRPHSELLNDVWPTTCLSSCKEIRRRNKKFARNMNVDQMKHDWIVLPIETWHSFCRVIFSGLILHMDNGQTRLNDVTILKKVSCPTNKNEIWYVIEQELSGRQVWLPLKAITAIRFTLISQTTRVGPINTKNASRMQKKNGKWLPLSKDVMPTDCSWMGTRILNVNGDRSVIDSEFKLFLSKKLSAAASVSIFAALHCQFCQKEYLNDIRDAVFIAGAVADPARLHHALKNDDNVYVLEALRSTFCTARICALGLGAITDSNSETNYIKSMDLLAKSNSLIPVLVNFAMDKAWLNNFLQDCLETLAVLYSSSVFNAQHATLKCVLRLGAAIYSRRFRFSDVDNVISMV